MKSREGIQMYLHKNGRFYNAFIDSNLKVYKNLQFAHKKGREISILRPDVSVNVLAVREGQEVRRGKVVALFENAYYTEQMSETQREIYDEIVKTYTPALIINRARREQEKPMGVLLSRIRDLGLPKTSGWLVAEAVLRHFAMDNENCPWLNNS